MTVVFDRNTEATELILNIILDRDDLKVTEVIAQRDYKNSYFRRAQPYIGYLCGRFGRQSL